MSETIVRTKNIDVQQNPAYGERFRIGLLALSTDLAFERDFALLAGSDDIVTFTTRINLATPNNEENFLALEKELPSAAALIVPSSRLDVIAFGCTSASMLIGPDRVEAAIRSGRPGINVTNPATAAMAALNAIDARRVAVLTPYTESVTIKVAKFLESNGFQLTDVLCLNLDLDDQIGRISEQQLRRFALQLDFRNADAIFVSCTAARSINVIEALERETGRPVITSNQATFWHALQLGGIAAPRTGFGSLLAGQSNAAA
jgi:maleate isomerase